MRVFFLALLSLGIPSLAATQTQPGTTIEELAGMRQSLAGVKHVEVLAAVIPTNAPSIPTLTQSSLQTRVELVLRRAGVPVGIPLGSGKDEQVAWLFVTVRVACLNDVVCATTYDLAAHQGAAVIAHAGLAGMYITWHAHSGSIAGIQRLDDLAAQIEPMLDRFCNDWLAVNR
jgi:hypothetical protein